ncbi:hypothetical protein SAMN04487905_12117 [Actinopolyspora xinjiangensis]|uniref:Secreted protein n=2 Tax=Actinopolyspora xinjiangensis TaxID=405564 RepID=A0A1H0X127_9ACTN|nr:hypothetical protein SAMN04487905_12117 [Actinopolyspora xinjiangensis]
MRMRARSVAVAAMATMAMGLAAPMATASEFDRQQQKETTQAVEALQASDQAPDVVEEGLDERLSQLPPDRTLEDVVKAMYPGDEAAQQAVLNKLTGMSTAGFWDQTWKYTKCAAYVSLLFVPGAKAYRAIKALGGVAETARLLIGAGNAADFLEIAGGVGSQIIGAGGIAKNCF